MPPELTSIRRWKGGEGGRKLPCCRADGISPPFPTSAPPIHSSASKKCWLVALGLSSSPISACRFPISACLLSSLAFDNQKCQCQLAACPPVNIRSPIIQSATLAYRTPSPSPNFDANSRWHKRTHITNNGTFGGGGNGTHMMNEGGGGK